MSNSFQSRIRYTGPRKPWRVITRDNILDWLRTLAWTIPLTLLVWLWAERQQLVRTPSPIAIPVALRTNSPDVVVKIISPADRNVMAILSGPQHALDDTLRTISSPNSADRVYINVDSNVMPGRYAVPTSRIEESPLLAGSGVSVVNASPGEITYTVERIVEADLPVTMPADVTNLDGAPAFDPPMVKFRGPQSVLDQLTADRQLAVYANVHGVDELHMPGPHKVHDVPLLPLPITDNNVSITPTNVTVSFKVRQTQEEMTYPSMPVWVLAPPVVSDRGYKVVIVRNSNLANVKLTGSPDVIAQLTSGALTPKPRAHVEVSLEDLPEGSEGPEKTRIVKYDLPDGVHVSSDDATRTVDFKLVAVGGKD